MKRETVSTRPSLPKIDLRIESRHEPKKMRAAFSKVAGLRADQRDQDRRKESRCEKGKIKEPAESPQRQTKEETMSGRRKVGMKRGGN